MFGAITHRSVLPRKGRSLIVVHSFGVQIVRIHGILFELCMREKKKEERRRSKKKNKVEMYAFNFLDCVEK